MFLNHAEFWPFHCEYIHVVVIRDGFLLPNSCLGKEWSGRARLHLDSTQPNLLFLRFDRQVQLSFFGGGIWIGDGDFAAFPFPNGRTCFTPGARLLPAIPLFQQNPTNGIFAHFP